MANCCEPIADFIDIFVLGEAEQAVVELANLIMSAKRRERLKKTSFAKLTKSSTGLMSLLCLRATSDDRRAKSDKVLS